MWAPPPRRKKTKGLGFRVSFLGGGGGQGEGLAKENPGSRRGASVSSEHVFEGLVGFRGLGLKGKVSQGPFIEAA